MLRLSGTDTMMLAAETPGWHFHVGGLSIVECEDDPHATLLRIAEEVERRLPLAPKFTWKLREVPFGLDVPVWVHDDDFDISRHVHLISLRAPCRSSRDRRTRRTHHVHPTRSALSPLADVPHRGFGQ